jgi:hypothetical protein
MRQEGNSMLVDIDDNDGLSELDVVENKQQQAAPQQQQQQPQETVVPEKYKGKTTEDIIRMHQEAEKLIGKQAQEVGEVRRLADDLIKQSLASKPQHIEQEPEIDFFEDPRKAIQKELSAHPDVIAAREATQQFKKMQIHQKLGENHPDFAQVVQDPEFANWVKGSNVRMSLYAKADAEYDYDSANELLSTFKQIKSVKAQETKKAGETARTSAMKAASVDVGGTGESSKKVYRRSDLIRLRMTDPSRYESLSDEIMKAYQEGRVK